MITVSIVLYKTDRAQLDCVLNCVLNSTDKNNNIIVEKIYLIDNSPSDELKSYADYRNSSNKIEYIFNNSNIGYGAAHNIAIRKSIASGNKYHLILNPDIRFDGNILNRCLEYMDENPDVGYLLPKVIYPDGEIQYLCKLLPTPTDLIFRRFIPAVGLLKKWKERINNRYTLKASGYDRIMNPPCLSGCFMLLANRILKDNNLMFDETFFMYCEDFDLMRRIHSVAKTVFFPNVSIIHDHAQESYKSKKMLLQHIKSAVYYFNKWGWLFDGVRRRVNREVLKQVKGC